MTQKAAQKLLPLFRHQPRLLFGMPLGRPPPTRDRRPSPRSGRDVPSPVTGCKQSASAHVSRSPAPDHLPSPLYRARICHNPSERIQLLDPDNCDGLPSSAPCQSGRKGPGRTTTSHPRRIAVSPYHFAKAEPVSSLKRDNCQRRPQELCGVKSHQRLGVPSASAAGLEILRRRRAVLHRILFSSAHKLKNRRPCSPRNARTGPHNQAASSQHQPVTWLHFCSSVVRTGDMISRIGEIPRTALPQRQRLGSGNTGAKTRIPAPHTRSANVAHG